MLNGDNYKFAGFDISIPNDTAFNLKYSIIRNRYEESEQKLINKYLIPDTNVIELGGSLGLVSKLITNILNSESIFVTIEANPNIISYCKKNIYLKRRSHTTFVENFAIAYGTDKIKFHISEDVSCSRVANNELVENIEIPACTLATIANKYLGDKSFTLVMDIEGGELDVFKYDREILKNCGLAIVEVHSQIIDGNGFKEEDFLGLARDVGLFPIDKDGSVYALRRKN
tara:strand:+ start:502 stop:1188 length:687 start_codon:yes stop_codon:yes gene_type:complete